MSERLVSDKHIWLTVEGNRATVGITDYAQQQTGDLEFINLPKIGQQVTIGESFADIESLKAIVPLISPLDGTVVETHAEVAKQPTRVNDNPYDAWLVKFEFTRLQDNLLTEAEYRNKTHS
ncbi:MAG: glycine cleavage system protein H [Kiritimatiellae bacterium]|nr:glycine cleavage system protein H [Kiritimatiellia bacterium]